ncbi:MAG: hypothetical protein U0903_19920 [Planctomycetales bacterium]
MSERTAGEDGEDTEMLSFRDKVFDAVEESVGWMCPSLAGIKDDAIHDLRSCVLIEIGDEHFLATASHDMQSNLERDVIYAIAPPNKESSMIPLFTEHFWFTIDKRLDLSVTKLTKETVNQLRPHYRFVHLSSMMSMNDRKHGTGMYLILGFPSSMLGPDAEGIRRSIQWKHLTAMYRGDLDDIENYDRNCHIILIYERETYYKGQKRVHPPGMSGCGIWYVGHPTRDRFFQKDKFRLAGIQTAWSKKFEYAKGTWIDRLLMVMWEYYPETRASMKLNGIDLEKYSLT